MEIPWERSAGREKGQVENMTNRGGEDGISIGRVSAVDFELFEGIIAV